MLDTDAGQENFLEKQVDDQFVLIDRRDPCRTVPHTGSDPARR
jgi:hypothetical protein